MEKYIFLWLNAALDSGISELDFWEMTLAEIKRAVDSKVRVDKARAQERATFDYILANLVGVSVSRCIDGKADYPTLEEVYSSLFEEETKAKAEEKRAKEEEIQAVKDTLSALRFKQYADFHNSKYKGGANVQ